MPNIKEIVDSKSKLISTDTSNPGVPSVKEMRKSQADGNTIKGSEATDGDDESTGDSFPAYLGGRA